MTQSSLKYQTLAPLGNVAAFQGLVTRLEERPHGIPGMGCFYGPSGYGKSTAGLYVANQTRACVVQVKSVWGVKALCEAICEELSLSTKGTVSDLVKRLGQTLAEEAIPLFIDEADFLVSKKMIEVVRDIYESSFVPVVLIGEELLPQKLQQWERIHGRILSWIAAEPCDDEDFELLMRIRLPEVELAGDLQDRIKTVARGSARRIVENLEGARELAALTGKSRLCLADWGDRSFYTGAAPDPRRF